MQEDRLLRLERLARIRESGGLTEEEFQRLKESIRNAEESHATPSLRTETDEETYRRQKRLSEIAQRSTAEEDRERYRANTQIVRARQKLEAPKSAYLAFFGAMLFGGFFLWRAIEPPIETEIFIADCLTQSGYDDVCKGKRAALRGELGGDARQRVLLIGESELNIELDEARIDAISGQEVEVAGRFGRGGMSSREEVRPAKIVQVLTSQADAGQRIAAREARSERETIRERCVGRTPGDLASTLCELEMGSSNSMLAYTSCMEDAGQLERRCRAAGF